MRRYTQRNKAVDTGAVASFVYEFQNSEPGFQDYVAVTVSDGDYQVQHTITSDLWSEMLAAAQDRLAITFPTIPAHDNDDHGGDGGWANDDHD